MKHKESIIYHVDVGRNPRGRSFTFGEDPTEKHENARKNTRENAGRNERITQPTSN